MRASSLSAATKAKLRSVTVLPRKTWGPCEGTGRRQHSRRTAGRPAAPDPKLDPKLAKPCDGGQAARPRESAPGEGDVRMSRSALPATRPGSVLLAASLLAAGLLAASPSRADDKYAGYYYPPPQDIETY